MIQLRDYQEKARVDLRLALREHQSVLTVLPTGSGKTALAAALTKLLFDAGKRVGFACHRRELLKQTAGTFDKFGVPYSYVAAGNHFNPYHRIYICSTPTLKNRLGRIPFDYLFVDEAHLSMAAGWKAVVGHYKEQGTRIIGLTATPERLDGKPLGENFETMVIGPNVGEMIERGNLSRYRAYAPAGVDLTGVKTRGGDYVSSEIDAIMEGKAVLAGAVRHWKRLADGMRTIAFTPSVERAEQLAQEFRENGVSAVSVDGNTPMEVRTQAFNDFADRKVKVITSVNLFSEGFDLAAQVGRDVTVECALLYRPTQSLALHLQQIGRALRKKPNPAIILDLVGNLARLGFPDDEREWSLEGRKKDKREVKVTECPGCAGVHHPAPVCPYCGHVYEKAVAGGGREVQEVDGDLEEVDVEALRRQRKMEQARAETLQDLVNLATARGYKSPEKWAGHVWSARQAKRGAA